MSVVITTSHPRVDREFAYDLCQMWGIDPNTISEVTFHYDATTREGVVQFWGHEREEGYWAYEVGAPSSIGPVIPAADYVLLHTVRYAITAGLPEFKPSQIPPEFKARP